MNFAQKLGLFILILISVAYVYLSYFGKDFHFPDFSKNNNQQNETTYNPETIITPDDKTEQETQKQTTQNVKIYILDKNGNIRSVNRTCDALTEKSCFEYAIKELVKAPSKWEKSKGFQSEIPTGTKVLSIREGSGSVMMDLSSNFEAGGGAESTYLRIKQVIKTANANSKLPVYLYINGHQANVIGGEGIMLKQPLNERSLDE